LIEVGERPGAAEQTARAVASLERAVVLATELQDLESATMARHHLAACQATLGDYEGSIAAQRACLATIREQGYREGEAYALAELGRALYGAGRLEEALDHLLSAIDRLHELGDTTAAATFLGDVGFVYRGLGEITAATTAWHEALAGLGETDPELTRGVRLALRRVSA
jgi:tetratricopeptide (TPR) repeat protein